MMKNRNKKHSIIAVVVLGLLLSTSCSKKKSSITDINSDSGGSTGGGGSSPSSGTTSSKITPSLQASRTSGVAPLAVLFDATATSNTLSVDNFRELTYSFDFGDDRGLTWANSGSAKNTESGGPIAAHVFDNAGTYSVKVRATNSATGDYNETTVTITVTSADTFYAGTNTICVSGSSNFTGCPSGATQQTSVPTGTDWNGKRVLFHKGETFTDLQILDGNSQVQVGAYGTGAAPIVNSVGVGNWRPTSANFANDITVMDLAVTTDVEQCLGKQVLFYRLDMTSSSNSHGFYIGNIKYWAVDDGFRTVATGSFYYANQIFLVENSVTGSLTDGGYNTFGDGSQVALLGNTFSTSKYYGVRLNKLRKAILAHNLIKGINSTGFYNDVAIHSGGTTTFTDAYLDDSWYTEEVLIAHNTIGDATNNNRDSVYVASDDNAKAEGIKNVTIENNTFVHNSNSTNDLILGGTILTYRNNSIQGGGSVVATTDYYTGALSAGWKGPYYSN